VCPIFTLALSLTPVEYPHNAIGKPTEVGSKCSTPARAGPIPKSSDRSAQETAGETTVQQEAGVDGEGLEVWIDQDLCTGDGICAQYAPEVFELDIDGLAYVKSSQDELLQAPGATTPVPLTLLRDVADSAKECPGDCIHVRRVSDRVEVYGPDAE
jgi:ferredoxin